MKQKTVFIISVVVLLLGFAAAALFYSAQEETRAHQAAQENRAALVRMHSPTLGKADAPVVIVEFLDPACETCRAFYPGVKQLLASEPDKIRLVLRYAPFHQGSDKVVTLLEAARRQGKFWPALEVLLANQSRWTEHHVAHPARAWEVLGGIGLDMEQLAFDMTSPEIAARIAQDLADASTLGVSKTPEFFVNGRPLPRFGFEPLQALVSQALAESAAR